jgi:hypothetical protein
MHFDRGLAVRAGSTFRRVEDSSRNRGAARRGATLIEVVMGCLLLTVLAIAGGAYFYQGRTTLSQARDKRAALERANGRLEALRMTGFAGLAMSSPDFNTYFIAPSGGNWVRRNTDPGETVVINGQTRPIRTWLQYVDVDAGSASYDALRARVEVAYGRDASETITVETLYAP